MKTLETQAEIIPVILVPALTETHVKEQLFRLFDALQNATDDPATACLIVEKLCEAIESDPELSRVILTPENIGKAMVLKAQGETGKLKLKHIIAAYPAIKQHFPMVSMLETFGI